jgi:hypothetical protein
LNIFDTFVSLIKVSRSEVEGEVENRVFNNLVIVVDALEIVKSGSFDEVILLAALHCIEMWNFKCKYVEG